MSGFKHSKSKIKLERIAFFAGLKSGATKFVEPMALMIGM